MLNALGVRCAVNADVTTARLDVSLEYGLLLVVEGIAGGAKEDHHLVFLELLVVEHALGILGPEHIEVVQLPEAADGRDAGENRLMGQPAVLEKISA